MGSSTDRNSPRKAATTLRKVAMPRSRAVTIRNNHSNSTSLNRSSRSRNQAETLICHSDFPPHRRGNKRNQVLSLSQ